jgi:hypothetical protein
LWLIKVWFSASTFVVKIATFAKRQNVSHNAKKTTTMKTFLTILIFIPLFSYSQKQGNVWYFGDHAGLDFNTSAPTTLLDGLTDFPSCCGWNEGCSSISDSSGSLLFYTNGNTVWNNQQLIMTNGSGLMGHASSCQSSIIVPKPNSERYFYVFTTDAQENGFVNGFRYSLVDMCLGGGYGGVISTEKNIKLVDTVSEKLACVQHSNGIDYWIIVQKQHTDIFYSFLLSSAGIIDTVVSHTGNVRHTGIGQLKASPNGQLLATATINDFYASVFYPGYHSLLDFNNTTGIISNERLFTPTSTEYAVEFSPDNSKLYFSTIGHGEINQYDLSAGSFAAINASKVNVISPTSPDGWRQMQLGPDGKLYISRTMKSYISVIEFPNSLCPACNYIDSYITLGGKQTSFGLPNFIAGYNYSNEGIDCSVGIVESVNTFSLKIYPNPFSRQTIFQTSEFLQDATLTIYNLYGQMVKQIGGLSGQTITFNRDDLQSGIYFIQLMQDNKLLSKDKLLISDN